MIRDFTLLAAFTLRAAYARLDAELRVLEDSPEGDIATGIALALAIAVWAVLAWLA